MKVETLAQMVARLDDEVEGINNVYLFTAYLPRSIAYDNISNEIHTLAEAKGVYVGDIKWVAQDATTAKLLIGLGKTQRGYYEYYNKWSK
jgi:hypothetical protein